MRLEFINSQPHQPLTLVRELVTVRVVIKTLPFKSCSFCLALPQVCD
jgi:hypothetical protein